ncbi:hypothetical protein ES332_D07G234900v1 [Gossypium tomentosum]|uniref:Uncharacterized protein n=1 Tax=Gossypium tomentosum TaxID=34277 RepID=A0A5D2KBN9_GOSTO|nr:hypothetical protein ES332_D07G234900v1 [Gossypium tomentosum]
MEVFKLKIKISGSYIRSTHIVDGERREASSESVVGGISIQGYSVFLFIFCGSS